MAQLIATRSTPGTFETYLDHIEERLYRAQTGKYYVEAQGGPLTPYAKKDRKTGRYTVGKRTVYMTYDEAYDWASRVMAPADFRKAFGLEPIEGELRKLDVVIKMSTQRALRRIADRQGISMGEAIDYIAETVLMDSDDEDGES